MIVTFFDSIIDLFLLNPIAQTSGFIGMICVWIAFLYKDDLKTIKMLFIASVFWGILYIGLESYVGLIATIISALRLYLSMKYKKNTKVFLFLIILITITGFFSYDSYYSFLPILGSFIGAYCFFYFSGILLRIGCLFISIIWMIYSISIGSIGGVINEIVVEVLILITLYNYIGTNGYKLIFMSKIKSILHPYRDIDYGHLTIVKDKDKIKIKYDIIEKFKKAKEHYIALYKAKKQTKKSD